MPASSSTPSSSSPTPAPGGSLAVVIGSLAVVVLGFTPWNFDLLATKCALLMAGFPALTILVLGSRGKGSLALLAPLLLAAALIALVLTESAGPEIRDPRYQPWLLLALLPIGLVIGWRRSDLQTLGLEPVPGPLLAVAGLVLIGRARAAGGLPGMATSAGLDQDLILVMLLMAALLVRGAFWSRPALLPTACSVVGTIVAGLAILQRIGWLDPFAAVNPGHEAVSTFGNTNAAAAFLAPLFVTSLVHAVSAAILGTQAANRREDSRRSGPHAFWSLGAATVIGIALILMRSRGAALAAFVGAAVATAWLATSPERRQWTRAARWRLLLAPLATGVIGIAILLLHGTRASTSAAAAPALSSTEQRLAILEDTARMIAARPLTGHGPGSFRVVFPTYRSPELAAETGRFGLPTEVDQPHNDYFWLAAERGLPASALWVAGLVALLVIGWKASRLAPDMRRGLRGCAATASVATLATAGLSFPVLSEAAPALLLFSQAGIILAFRDDPLVRPPSPLGRIPAGLGTGFVLLVALAAGSLSVASRLTMARVGASGDASTPEAFGLVHARLARAAALDPTNVDAVHVHRALLLTRAQAPDGDAWIREARRAQERLEARLPLEPGLATNRALLDLLEGDREAALRAFRAAARRMPGGPTAVERMRRAEEHLAAVGRLPVAPDGDAIARAKALRGAGRDSDARRLLDEHLQADPDDGDALHLLGLLLRDAGDEAEAERYLRRAQLAFAIEWILSRNWDRARTNLRIARRYTDDDGAERALEALILLLQGDREAARARAAEGGIPGFAHFPPFVRTATLPVRRLFE